MSTDSSNARPTEENSEQKVDRPLSFKKKFERFVQKNKKILFILGIVIGLSLFALSLYLLFFRESKMERFANQFCTCAESSQSDFYNYTKDGFGYKSDLSTCFGMKFSSHGQHYNKATKRLLLEKFKKAVAEKCPEKLEKVFEYQ